jgi:hypothetical protein
MRRFPAASIEQAFLIRRARVSGCLAEVIQWIHRGARRGVMSDHNVRAFGAPRSSSQICRHRRFWFLYRRRDLEGDNVAGICACRFALPVHFEPVAFLAVRLRALLEKGSAH